MYGSNGYIMLYGIIAMAAVCHVDGITVGATQTKEELILMEMSKCSSDGNSILQHATVQHDTPFLLS